MPSVFVSRNVEDAALVAFVMMVAVGVYVAAKHVLAALVKKQESEKQQATTRDEVILSVAKQNTTTAAKRRNRNKSRRATKEVISTPETVATRPPAAPQQQASSPVPDAAQTPAAAKPEAPPASASSKEDSYAAIAAVAALAVMTDVTVTLQKPDTTTIVTGNPRTPLTSEKPSFGDYYGLSSEDGDISDEPRIENDSDEIDEAMPPLIEEEDSHWSLFSADGENSASEEAQGCEMRSWNPLCDAFDSRKALNGVFFTVSAASTSPRETLRDPSCCSTDTGSSRNSVFDEETATDTDSDDDSAEPRITASAGDSPIDSHLSSFFMRNLPLNSYRSPLFFPTAHGDIPLLPRARLAVVA
ncbi:hypothetical protein DIPPA_16394 [Diplonema papillatum]|nr:hypothetical protein DIPPA_16394 [Diplonema papillatum]